MKRLDFLASLLKGSDIVLDIGSDHGLVLKKAFDKNYISKGLASDIALGPLSAAQNNLKDYNVDFYLSDGFKRINDNSYDTVLIAGMGAYLIAEILDLAKKDCKYILQANEKTHILRKYLSENGFQITNEHIIKEGYYYVILECKKGTQELSEEEYYVGPILKNKEESKDYFMNKIKIIDSYIDKVDEKTREEYVRIKNFYQKYSQ